MDTNKSIDQTVDEIQRLMDQMDKKTFGSTTGMEWEGSIQNAPLTQEESETNL